MSDDRKSGAKLKRAETTEDILDVALSRGRRTKAETKEKPEDRAA